MSRPLALSLAITVALASHPLEAAGQTPALDAIGIDQHLDAQVPLDLAFRGPEGAEVTLGDVVGDRPAVLMLGYYGCPMLCPQALDDLVEGLRRLELTVGEDFSVVFVSIDPEEGPADAARRLDKTLRDYDRGPLGWHLWTGPEQAIARLAEAVGFRFAYDAETDQYGHAAGIMLLTPDGRVSRYLLGTRFSPKDLKLGLIEAGRDAIGSPAEKLLLRCYHYDPETGRYGLAVMRLVRVGGLFTLLMLAGIVGWNHRRGRTRT